jgi:hypothetical protein
LGFAVLVAGLLVIAGGSWLLVRALGTGERGAVPPAPS